MTWTLPREALKSLLHTLLTDHKRLTKQELAIATRIRHCSRCDHIWLGKRTGPPQRCHFCGKSRYDTPLIDAIMAATELPAIQLNQTRPPQGIPTPGAHED